MRNIFHWVLLATLIVAGGCADAETEPTQEDTGIIMNISRGNTADSFNFNERVNRIYLANREPEHDADNLHLLKATYVRSADEGQTLTYQFIKLLPQWYKVSVLSVPKIDAKKADADPINAAIFTEENPEVKTCDMNKQMIDYSAILAKGAGCESPDRPLPDGDIYRDIQNIWTEIRKPGDMTPYPMNFTLKRITGRLDLDMGILADQFANRVSKIQLHLETPTRMYILDNDKENVKTTDRKTITFETAPEDMRKVPEAARRHHVIHINLLPGLLKGKLVVTTVKDQGGQEEIFTYTFDDYKIHIKKNTRTNVKFNGILDGMFSVKYAGFDGTEIDVDESWNGGWEEVNK